jgi:hypothetical protein
MTLHYFRNDPTLETRALQIYLILIGAAKRRETITYGTLAEMIGFGGAGVMGQFLGPIMVWCENNELPALTCLVVRGDSGVPGEGLTTVSGGFPAEQQRVFEFDWYGIYPPTFKELKG